MKLTHEEVNELIGKYKSELRKLAYQQGNLTGIIKTLEGQSKSAPKRRGRPAKAKAAAPKAAPKKKVSPAKAKAAVSKTASAKTGYRLSEWDNLVMKTLNDRKKVSVFSDFMATAKAGGSKLSDQDIYRRINQSLHKLANKRKELVKVPQKGRGFGYALPGWKK